MLDRPTLRTVSLTLILAAVPSPLGVADAVPDEAPVATPVERAAVPEAIVADGLPPDLREVVGWALDLFERADLDLPPIEIEHHGGGTEHCDGHTGIHRRGGVRNVIELCTEGPGAATEAVVLHELAHAYVDHDVDRQRRDAFQALRGFDHWRDYDAVPWYENGTEQAAEIITWGLFDRPRAAIRIRQNSCDDLELGYRTLTGRAPLHGFRDLCPP